MSPSRCKKGNFFLKLEAAAVPGAVEFGISVPLAASDAAEPGQPWALEVPPAGR